MGKALRKDSLKELKRSYKRFFSIVIMAMLSVGFFVGMKAIKPNLRETLDVYLDKQNGYDIMAISTLGLTKEDVEAIESLDKVEKVYGVYDKDVMLKKENAEYVLKTLEYTENVNKPELLEGKFPSNAKECVVEKKLLSELNMKIGDIINISENETEEENIAYKNTELTIVGVVKSPLYISADRGNSKLGAGKIDYYIYVSKENIETDSYSSLYVLADGAKELTVNTKEYNTLIDKVKEEIEGIADQRRQYRYHSVVGEANAKLNDAQTELDTETEKAKKEIADAEKKIQDASNELTKGEQTLNENKAKADKEFAAAEATIKENEGKYNEGKKQAQEGIQQAEKQKSDLQVQLAQINNQIAQIGFVYGTSTPETQAVLDAQLIELNKNKVQIEAGIQTIENTIAKTNTDLESGRLQLENARQELEKNKTNTYSEIKKARAKIENGKKDLERGKEELAENKIIFENKIKEAQDKITEAKEKISEIEYPKWYVLDRKESNMSYSSLMQDSESVDSLSSVFPVLFFAVATLMSLTSMTRMVDEQRTLIGTLKALGYNKLQIASKYIIYAILATSIGSVVGSILGYMIIPTSVVNAYLIIYPIPPAPIIYNMHFIIIGFLIVTICIVGGAIYTSYRKLRHVPATLMRPKAPKPGKRVLLERITFIWKRLKFTQKVTIRNIFRYKKRFLMTIMGIMGATALVIVGFGVKDSISQLIPIQYKEIYQYQIQLGIKEKITQEEIKGLSNEIKQKEEIKDVLFTTMQSQKIVKNNEIKDVQLIIMNKDQNTNQFIMLRNRKSKKEIDWNDKTVIITERIASLLNIRIGDSITIRNEDNVEKELIVGGITEQYVLNYMYMTEDLYQEIYKEIPKTNVFLLKTNNINYAQEQKLKENFLKDPRVSSVSTLKNDQINKAIAFLNYIVIILIVSSGLLTFVILYNLSNVNISERIRELATLKVLGFYDKEVNEYVNREMAILTVIGILLGLVCGYFLTSFVLQVAQQEMIMYPELIKPISYIYAAAMIAGFTIIVNIFSHFSLKKVNMVESLKSIE